MELVVGIAIGALVVVFIGCAAALAFIIRKKICLKQDLLSQQLAQNNPDVQLIEDGEPSGQSISLEEMLHDDLWVENMSELVSRCLPLLRTCHNLTLKLVPVILKECQHESESTCITDMAKRINPRIEEVVQMLDRPVEPQVLEMKCTSLVMSMTNLLLVMKSVCRHPEIIQWVNDSITEVENNLKTIQDINHQPRAISKTMTNHRERRPSPCNSDGTTSSSRDSNNTDESGIDVQIHSDLCDDPNEIVIYNQGAVQLSPMGPTAVTPDEE